MLSGIKNIHFIGIGGIGMSAIAQILLSRGFKITGSDIQYNQLIKTLWKNGAQIQLGHNEDNLPNQTQLVVYNSCIKNDNPELRKARSLGIPVIHRTQMLAELLGPQEVIAVTGAHGKTTTSGMLSVLLCGAGFDPTVIVGGEMDYFGSNFYAGKGTFAVVEVDESDRTFLKIKPTYLVLTNIDEEHLDCYGFRLEALMDANRLFMEGLKEGGFGIFCVDDKNVRKIIKGYNRDIFTYGIHSNADLTARNIKMSCLRSQFDLYLNNTYLGCITLNVPGLHNIQNSLGAMLAGLKLGIDKDIIISNISRYTGTKRRFELKAEIDGVTVIEDYAHHPTEISATIRTAKRWFGRRLVGVFQPHRYTRTKLLKERFVCCFDELDILILTDIYGAFEEPIEGVCTGEIYELIQRRGHPKVEYIVKERLVEFLYYLVRGGDILLIMGAGDINEVTNEFVKRIQHKGVIQRAAK